MLFWILVNKIIERVREKLIEKSCRLPVGSFDISWSTDDYYFNAFPIGIIHPNLIDSIRIIPLDNLKIETLIKTKSLSMFVVIVVVSLFFVCFLFARAKFYFKQQLKVSIDTSSALNRYFCDINNWTGAIQRFFCAIVWISDIQKKGKKNYTPHRERYIVKLQLCHGINFLQSNSLFLFARCV